MDGLKTLLLADAGVSALLGSRLYSVVLPRSYQFPASVYHVYGTSLTYTFAGPDNVAETLVQYDVYGVDATSTRNVADAIRGVLDSYTGTLANGMNVQAVYLQQDLDMPHVPDAAAKGVTYHIVLQFRVIHTTA